MFNLVYGSKCLHNFVTNEENICSDEDVVQSTNIENTTESACKKQESFKESDKLRKES